MAKTMIVLKCNEPGCKETITIVAETERECKQLGFDHGWTIRIRDRWNYDARCPAHAKVREYEE